MEMLKAPWAARSIIHEHHAEAFSSPMSSIGPFAQALGVSGPQRRHSHGWNFWWAGDAGARQGHGHRGPQLPAGNCPRQSVDNT
eukprot:7090893-Pyramimonas_sp.AAC.1